MFNVFRHIEDTLTFSINTLEKLFIESNTNAVLRLEENRIQKLQHLQKSLLARNRELDQRSTEIGTMNEAHLSGFQEKAKIKLKICEDELVELTQEMHELVRNNILKLYL